MSDALLDTAQLLLDRPGGSTPADASRAVSTIYYALFHFLAKHCCDLFVGATEPPPNRAWEHLYRSLNHATIDDRCRNIGKMRSKNFHVDVIEFADFIRQAQWKRERCDYCFNLSPSITSVTNDIAQARDLMQRFLASPETHRRAFAVYLLFKEDRHEKKIITV